LRLKRVFKDANISSLLINYAKKRAPLKREGLNQTSLCGYRMAIVKIALFCFYYQVVGGNFIFNLGFQFFHQFRVIQDQLFYRITALA
jgi:hypothetical protein